MLLCGKLWDCMAKYCSKCGKEINENAKFCPYCGKAVGDLNMNSSFSNANEGKDNTNDANLVRGSSIASLALGVIGLLINLIGIFSFGLSSFIAIIFGILAISFGIYAKTKNSKDGFSTGGLICGIIATLLSIVGIIICITQFVGFANNIIVDVKSW